jgi:LacI family transcriptional regulator, gluconate utilization system Gnt-I transcriptional repressor
MIAKFTPQEKFVIMTNPEKSSVSLRPQSESRQRKTHGRITLADVARHAGVTTMTVSRTLREPHRVTAETAERVTAALKHTGYAPNKSAGLLASGRSRIVAAIIPNIANSIFAETIQGLTEALQADGYELLLAATGYSLAREEDQIRAVLGWAPSALIVTGRHHTEGALALMRRAQLDGVPVIEMWDQSSRATQFIQVGFNHRKAGKAMLDHLTHCGYRDLVYVGSGVVGDLRAKERQDGFLTAARKAGCGARLVTAPAEEPMAAGRKVLQQLISQSALPQAIAFSNDYFAAGACLQAAQQGIKIPAQLGIMGFGDMTIAGQLAGGISTLAVPRFGIGFRTGECVLAQMGAPPSTPLRGTHLLEPRLVVRQTTRMAHTMQ